MGKTDFIFYREKSCSDAFLTCLHLNVFRLPVRTQSVEEVQDASLRILLINIDVDMEKLIPLTQGAAAHLSPMKSLRLLRNNTQTCHEDTMPTLETRCRTVQPELTFQRSRPVVRPDMTLKLSTCLSGESAIQVAYQGPMFLRTSSSLHKRRVYSLTTGGWSSAANGVKREKFHRRDRR